jgi:hypothetical protein
MELVARNPVHHPVVRSVLDSQDPPKGNVEPTLKGCRPITPGLQHDRGDPEHFEELELDPRPPLTTVFGPPHQVGQPSATALAERDTLTGARERQRPPEESRWQGPGELGR